MAKFHSKITIDLDLNFHFVWSVVDVIIKVNIYVLQQTISMFEHYKENLSKIDIETAQIFVFAYQTFFF